MGVVSRWRCVTLALIQSMTFGREMSEGETRVLSRQDILLTQLQQAKVPVCMYLRSGVKLEGFIKGFDSGVIILRTSGKEQMLYKHTILTIVPSFSF